MTKEASEQLIELLGHPYNPKQVQALLQPFGVKRMPFPNSYFNDDIIWSVKSSLRIDIYRAPKINIVIEYEHTDEGSVMISYTACLIGCIGAWRNDNPEVYAP